MYAPMPLGLAPWRGQFFSQSFLNAHISQNFQDTGLLFGMHSTLALFLCMQLCHWVWPQSGARGQYL